MDDTFIFNWDEQSPEKIAAMTALAQAQAKADAAPPNDNTISRNPKPQKKKDGDKRKSAFANAKNNIIPTTEIDFWIKRAIRGDKLEPFDFILPGMMKKTASFVAGGGGGGKTTTAIQTAVSLCFGVDIFGFYSREFTGESDDEPWKMTQRKVTYLTLEDDAETILRKIDSIFRFLKKNQKIKRWEGIDLDKLRNDVQENFKIIDLSGCGSDGWIAGPTIDEDERRAREDELIELLRGADIAFFDTLRRIHSYSEVDDSGAATIMRSLERIAKLADIAVVGLCHTTKECSLGGLTDVEGLRGSSVLKDDARWVAIIAPVGIVKNSQSQRVKIDEGIRRKYVRFHIPKANKIPPWIEGWFERGSGGVLFRTTDDVDGLIESSKAKAKVTQRPAQTAQAAQTGTTGTTTTATTTGKKSAEAFTPGGMK